MSKPPDQLTALAAVAAPSIEPTVYTLGKFAYREIPGAEDPEMRFQIGEIVTEDVHSRNAALNPAGYHDEENASFFKLIAWGSSWSGADAHRKRNQSK